ncbi:MAG: hypothetical protein OEY16_05535, partial [Alphaproteobacteria bacterium]|nr:hypothetical protein [Alphaproteobacteria bacterium]
EEGLLEAVVCGADMIELPWILIFVSVYQAIAVIYRILCRSAAENFRAMKKAGPIEPAFCLKVA